MPKPLLNECGAINNESLDDCDSGLSDFIGNESEVFKITENQIMKDLSDMKLIVVDLNKMRENVAQLELDLLTRFNGSTWKELSDLIGLSSTMMMNECMKILAPKDGTTWNVTK